LSHLSERYDPALSPYPVHPGADHYYRRDEPSFVQRYMNEITFAITVGALLWSAFSALRAARRQKQRNRVENYLIAARNVVSATGDAGEAELLEARRRLVETREKAIGELADEKLDANDAFAILLDYRASQIAELDRRRESLNDARA
jgi:hypothetical protein